jgi:hypothetical protein
MINNSPEKLSSPRFIYGVRIVRFFPEQHETQFFSFLCNVL